MSTKWIIIIVLAVLFVLYNGLINKKDKSGGGYFPSDFDPMFTVRLAASLIILLLLFFITTLIFK